MGYKGLSAYISQKTKYFQDHKLSNCSLIVDGNNIACILYRVAAKSNYVFNGDYPTYATEVRKFFLLLLSCNIKPFVILDGGFELRKLNTIQTRLLYSTKEIGRLRKEKNSDPFLPLLILEVFKETLQDLHIKFAQSRYEADLDIVQVAKCFNCPILSSDSDYYLFDAGFIPFTTLDFSSANKKKEEPFISCKIFFVDQFLNDHGGLPDKSFLSLLAVVLGDYMEIKHFKKLYLSLLDSEESKKKFRLTNYKFMLHTLCYWFKEVESFDAAALKILQSVPIQFRRFLSKQLKLISERVKKPEESPLVKYFSDDSECDVHLSSQLDALHITNDCDTEFKESESPKIVNCLSPNGKVVKIPEWYLRMEREGAMSRHVSNILNLRTVLLWTQMEDFNLPSIYVVSFPILRVVAGIILTTSARRKSAPLTCYVRVNCEIGKELLVPEYPEESINFNNIIFLPLSTRRSILLNALQIQTKDFQNIPEEWLLFFLSIIYWFKNSKESAHKALYIGAFILSYLLLNLLTDLYSFSSSNVTLNNDKKSQRKLNCDHDLLNEIKAEDTRSVLDLFVDLNKNNADFELVKLFQFIDKTCTSEKEIDKQVTHFFAEFQVVFHFTQILNSILDFPIQSPVISKSLCGSLFYRLVFSMRKSSSMYDFIHALPCNISVKNLFLKSLEVLENNLFCDLVKSSI